MEEKDQSLCGTDEFESYEESCDEAGSISIFERLITCRVHTTAGGPDDPHRCGGGPAIGRPDDVLERGQHDQMGETTTPPQWPHQELEQPWDAHAGSGAQESGVGSTWLGTRQLTAEGNPSRKRAV